MKELMEELDYAYRLVSSVPVAGDDIDTISEARARMRNVFNELKRMDGEQKSEGQTDV